MGCGITETSTIVVGGELSSCDLEGEAVILSLKSGEYFGLNGVGSRIWELVRQPTTVRDIREAIVAEFDVDSDRCQRDLLKWLEEMVDEGLIEIRQDGGAG